MVVLWSKYMAIDLMVVIPQEAINVSQVLNVPGLVPRSLHITGADFRAVEEVLMNEVTSPSFIVLSKTELIAQVPAPLVSETISSVSVLSRRLTMTARSFLTFRLGATAGKVRGILRLEQLFLRMLLMTPGSDIFAPQLGGGALARLGSSVSVGDGSDIVSDFIISVDNTSKQVIQIQGQNQSIPPDERLLSADVVASGFNKNETALLATIAINSQAGQQAVARLQL
jgi:hypothetical protein